MSCGASSPRQKRSSRRWVAELDRRPLRVAPAVEPVERALLPAVLPTQELVDSLVLDHARGRFDPRAAFLAAEVRRSDEHTWIASDTAHLPCLRSAPDEQPLAVVADDPHRRGHLCAVALEGCQADVASALEVSECIHRIPQSVHRILTPWQTSTSKRWSTRPCRSGMTAASMPSVCVASPPASA